MVGTSVSETSSKGNGSSSVLSQKRQRDETRLSETLLDLSILDCPICFDALTTPIFQCDNGHLACSSCCPKLKNKCPSCAFPIGHSRCRAMENVLGSIIIPCPNAKFECNKKFCYGGESLTHEKECSFSRCFCPLQDCNHNASYKDLYNHFDSSNHDIIHKCHMFRCGTSISVVIKISRKIVIIRESKMRLVFALQCFREPYGVYVTVSCIAPSSTEVGEFTYRLSHSVDGHTIIYESPKVKRVLKVTLQTPKENFLLVPNNLLGCGLLDLKLCIKKLNIE